jgi:small subunit ribosomal protein S15
VFLQWLKDQRTKKLKSIKTSNFERYVELIKQLNIEPLESTHTKYAKYKFRRFKIGVEIKEKKSLAVRKTPPLSKKSGE